MDANLAPVYVNDSRVTLQGDPKPHVSKIIEASGMQADRCEVMQLRGQKDSQGKPLKPDDVIDRMIFGNDPVYLKCIDRNDAAFAGAAFEGAEKGKTWQSYGKKLAGKTADSMVGPKAGPAAPENGGIARDPSIEPDPSNGAPKLGHVHKAPEEGSSESHAVSGTANATPINDDEKQ